MGGYRNKDESLEHDRYKLSRSVYTEAWKRPEIVLFILEVYEKAAQPSG